MLDLPFQISIYELEQQDLVVLIFAYTLLIVPLLGREGLKYITDTLVTPEILLCHERDL